ncbi:HlyD family type I secretion periplasmic adaptor subunit [Ramlibacter sp. MAHUQ-53]|uniref:HlyD family type I secretion periplasmic adaptor subunit n=1 Tax=unclassified Ramlibacter TaxID=2617605 RepID=UPI003645E6F5
MREPANPFGIDAIALQAQPPLLRARLVLWTLCALLAATLAYASWVRTDIVITAQGRVIASGRSKVVQSPEGGVVRRIAVRDGQAVRAGEVLIELDPTASDADRERLQREAWEAQADVERLAGLLAGHATLAGLPGMPPDLLAHQQALLAARAVEQRARVDALQAEAVRRQAERDTLASGLEALARSAPLVGRRLEMRESLARTGFLSDGALIDTRLEAQQHERDLALQASRLREAEAGWQAAHRQVALAEAEFRSRIRTELAEARRRREATGQELVKARQRREWQVLRSPIDGVVQQLAVATEGGVVTPAQALLTVVPQQAALEVEARVLNRDIGHVRVGQPVASKLEAFDFTRHGAIGGEVTWVGTDALQDPALGAAYPVRIRLDALRTPRSADGAEGLAVPGMNVAAEIRTGRRRLVDYFLSPLLRGWQESLRER